MRTRPPPQPVPRWIALLPLATVGLAIVAIIVGTSVYETIACGFLALCGIVSAVIVFRSAALEAAIVKKMRA